LRSPRLITLIPLGVAAVILLALAAPSLFRLLALRLLRLAPLLLLRLLASGLLGLAALILLRLAASGLVSLTLGFCVPSLGDLGGGSLLYPRCNAPKQSEDQEDPEKAAVHRRFLVLAGCLKGIERPHRIG